MCSYAITITIKLQLPNDPNKFKRTICNKPSFARHIPALLAERTESNSNLHI